MILSNIKIQEALDNGWLRITPEPSPRRPSPRRPSGNGEECPYQTSAVDLRLADEIVCFDKEQPLSVDLVKGKPRKLVEAISSRYDFPHDNPYTLEPNVFVLGQTHERITLPLPPDDSDDPCLAARIEGRSSYSRFGLLVHFTAPTIHAGFNGTITLEIMNLGPHSIQLRKHSYICQLIIEQVAGRPFPNDSQFQGQCAPTGAIASHP